MLVDILSCQIEHVKNEAVKERRNVSFRFTCENVSAVRLTSETFPLLFVVLILSSCIHNPKKLYTRQILSTGQINLMLIFYSSNDWAHFLDFFRNMSLSMVLPALGSKKWICLWKFLVLLKKRKKIFLLFFCIFYSIMSFLFFIQIQLSIRPLVSAFWWHFLIQTSREKNVISESLTSIVFRKLYYSIHLFHLLVTQVNL